MGQALLPEKLQRNVVVDIPARSRLGDRAELAEARLVCGVNHLHMAQSETRFTVGQALPNAGHGVQPKTHRCVTQGMQVHVDVALCRGQYQ